MALRIAALLLCLVGGRAQFTARAGEILSAPAPASAPSLPGAGVGPIDPAKPPPALPGTRTAADTFRELLEMPPAQRTEALAGKTEHQRKYLEGRLAEFQALTPEVREARLKQFELSCHLEALMKLAPAKRSSRLDAVPTDLRERVDERLRQWDLLPAKVQQEVMEHETTANYLLRVRPVNAPSRPFPTGTSMPPLPEEKPRTTAAYFNEFFSMPPRERQKTLEALPAPEREEMEKTLQAFANLAPEQRKICIDSFDKFSRMTKEQRDQFLQSAARWKTMSPRERETWRALLRILPPTAPAASAFALPQGSEGGPVTAASNAVLPGPQ